MCFICYLFSIYLVLVDKFTPCCECYQLTLFYVLTLVLYVL